MHSNAPKGAWFANRVGDHLRSLGHDIDREHKVEIGVQKKGGKCKSPGRGFSTWILVRCTLIGATMRLRKIIELRNTRFWRLSVSVPWFWRSVWHQRKRTRETMWAASTRRVTATPNAYGPMCYNRRTGYFDRMERTLLVPPTWKRFCKW